MLDERERLSLLSRYRGQASRLVRNATYDADMHWLAEEVLGIRGTTLRNKISAGRFTFLEFLAICDVLGYDLELVERNRRR